NGAQVGVRRRVRSELETERMQTAHVVPRHPLGVYRAQGIPPRIPCRADESCRDEKAGGQTSPLQLQRATSVVAISIVERDDEVTADITSGTKPVQEFTQRDDNEVTLEEVAVGAKLRERAGDWIAGI